MPRDMKASENQKRARARREHALARRELGQPTEARVSPAGPVSMAVKARDPSVDNAIAEYMAKRKLFHVYELVDSRDGAPFYVGCTINPASRINDHRRDPASAAYARMQEIIAAGAEAKLVILKSFGWEPHALRFEKRMIFLSQNLVNRDKPKELPE